MPQSSRDAFAKIDKLLNKVNLMHFIKPENSYGPATTAEKILMLKLAIQFIINLKTSTLWDVICWNF